MTIDMTNNRIPYGLLTDEEKAALHEHKGEFEHWCAGDWINSGGAVAFYSNVIYRTAHPPKTQDVIAWDRLPDWAQWVARTAAGKVYAYHMEPVSRSKDWMSCWNPLRIDEFPGIVSLGTADWRESKQRRPRG